MTDLTNSKDIALETAQDFRNYTELPNNNPLVIVASDFRIIYCNDSFRSTFKLDVNDDFTEMKSNLEFFYLLKGFGDSNYKNISLDISLSSDSDLFLKNYSVSIERVIIRSSQYFVLIIEPLDKRKKLEHKINSLHNALDQGSVPVIILDNEGRITYATRSFEKLLSEEIDKIYNKELTEVLSAVFVTENFHELKQALLNFSQWKKVVELKDETKTQFWEFTLNPVSDGVEFPKSFILVANDLTEHIEQTKAVEQSERKQKLIINNISDLLLIVELINSAALFENANDNFCSIFGLDKNTVHLHKIETFIPSNLARSIYLSIKDLSQHKKSFIEFHYKHDDEKEYLCKITSIIAPERNSTIYIITMKDITDEIHYHEQLKKAIHKEIQLNKMKSDFLANMSHEIRTPFNAVVGFSEIIDESLETENIDILKELMTSMKEVLGRALNLFTNIVEVSQIEAGEIEFDKVDLNCNQILRNVYNRMLPDAQRKNLDFALDLSEEECTIEIDWVKFEKIICSIVDNAIKYTPKGYVYLSSRVMDKSIVIEIQDTGVGIEKVHIERLLKPFTQEVEGYTRPFEGAGLGLTLAYKLSELMGGKFEMDSEKNKGTKISITFPVSK